MLEHEDEDRKKRKSVAKKKRRKRVCEDELECTKITPVSIDMIITHQSSHRILFFFSFHHLFTADQYYIYSNPKVPVTENRGCPALYAIPIQT